MVKQIKTASIIVSILMLGLGCLLAFKPKTSVDIICVVIAACFLLFGLFNLYEYFRYRKDTPVKSMGDLIVAIVFIVGAIVFFLHPFSVKQIIPLVLGVIIIVDGIVLIAMGIIYRNHLPKKGIISIVFGIACAAIGWYATTNPMTQSMHMGSVGICFIIAGVLNLGNMLLDTIGDKHDDKVAEAAKDAKDSKDAKKNKKALEDKTGDAEDAEAIDGSEPDLIEVDAEPVKKK